MGHAIEYTYLVLVCAVVENQKTTFLRDYKKIACSTQLSMKFFRLIKFNVKMPTIAGILTFMRAKNTILALFEPEKSEFLDGFVLMSI